MVCIENKKRRDIAVKKALADVNMVEYDPDVESNKMMLITRDAASVLIENERQRWGFDSPIYFAFANSWRFRAFAHNVTDDVVCLSAGLMVALYNAANFLLSDPQFLSFIEGEKEVAMVNPIGHLDIISYFTAVPTRIPKSSVRASLANAIFASAQQFVLSHEVAHILGGHVDILSGPYSEVSVFHYSDTMLIQSMEYEADMYGAIKVLLDMIEHGRVYKMDSYFMRLDSYAAHWDKYSAPMVVTIVSAYLVFRLVDQQYKDENLSRDDHPLAPIRQHYLCTMLLSYMNERKLTNMSGDTWVEIIYVFLRDVELSLSSLQCPGLSTTGLADSAFAHAMFSDRGSYERALSGKLRELVEKASSLGRGTFRTFYIPRI